MQKRKENLFCAVSPQSAIINLLQNCVWKYWLDIFYNQQSQGLSQGNNSLCVMYVQLCQTYRPLQFHLWCFWALHFITTKGVQNNCICNICVEPIFIKILVPQGYLPSNLGPCSEQVVSIKLHYLLVTHNSFSTLIFLQLKH